MEMILPKLIFKGISFILIFTFLDYAMAQDLSTQKDMESQTSFAGHLIGGGNVTFRISKIHSRVESFKVNFSCGEKYLEVASGLIIPIQLCRNL